MIEYISNRIPESKVDLVHYKTLWQQSFRDVNSSNLPAYLAHRGIVCSPCGFDLNTMNNEDLVTLVHNTKKDHIVFVNDFNIFYADSFLTFSKLSSFSRWISSLDNLNSCPLNSQKTTDYTRIKLLRVWLFKHNLTYTQVSV